MSPSIFYHGTSSEDVFKIQKTGFRFDLTGSNVGVLLGSLLHNYYTTTNNIHITGSYLTLKLTWTGTGSGKQHDCQRFLGTPGNRRTVKVFSLSVERIYVITYNISSSPYYSEDIHTKITLWYYSKES
jgi:hypothetical protein